MDLNVGDLVWYLIDEHRILAEVMRIKPDGWGRGHHDYQIQFCDVEEWSFYARWVHAVDLRHEIAPLSALEQLALAVDG